MVTRRGFTAALFASSGLHAAKDTPVKKAKVTKIFRSPEGHPNAMETVPEGVWIGEQVSDTAYLMDWKGNVLKKVQTESSNTSGIAFGDGVLWIAANGKAIMRDPKPSDATTGKIVKVDPGNGRTLARYDVPGGGGVHGLLFHNGKLWITSLKLQKLSQVDPKTFEVVHQIPCKLGRAHGLDWDKGYIWCMFSNERQIHRIDPKDGTVAGIVQLGDKDPDPHGMCMHYGKLYYCDAGIAPGAKPNNSPDAGWICRIDLV
ncbi:MAG TPA: glutaminyl-peptide cyclotransferase [Bryobacteraceae bacterium]|nr:glutaminyl-peptide cyclotransferase [Bryobacteraceae bacterium]